MTDDRKNKIMTTLQKHADAVKEQGEVGCPLNRCWLDGYSLMGVFLRGSQNYNCDTEKSDVDSVAIVMPNISRIVKGQQTISETIHVGGGEYCDVKDIRSFFENIKKQHCSYLEVLFTEFRILEDSELGDFIDKNAEAMASMSHEKFLNCCLGMMNRKMKDFYTPTAGTQEFFDKHGFDNKNFMHILRLEKLLCDRFVLGRTMKQSLKAFDWHGIEPYAREAGKEKLSVFCHKVATERMKYADNLKKDFEEGKLKFKKGYEKVRWDMSEDIDIFVKYFILKQIRKSF